MKEMSQFEFENFIYDLIADEKCEKVKQLEQFSDILHELIEDAFYDYCFDNNIEDYTPPY